MLGFGAVSDAAPDAVAHAPAIRAGAAGELDAPWAAAHAAAWVGGCWHWGGCEGGKPAAAAKVSPEAKCVRKRQQHGPGSHCTVGVESVQARCARHGSCGPSVLRGGGKPRGRARAACPGQRTQRVVP